MRKIRTFTAWSAFAPETLLAVVCDGMGGARAGNVASRLASRGLLRRGLPPLRDGMTEAEEQDVLCTAAKLANISVYEHEFSGMRHDARSCPSSAACAWRS